MAARIFIADDSETILSALRPALEDIPSFEICGTASNGAEAVALTQSLQPDVVILDLAMPVMNGLEAAREIGRHFPQLPILLYTLTDLQEIRMEAARSFVREVVLKSSGIEALISAIQSAIDSPLNQPVASADSPIAIASPEETTTELRKPSSRDLGKAS